MYPIFVRQRGRLPESRRHLHGFKAHTLARSPAYRYSADHAGPLSVDLPSRPSSPWCQPRWWRRGPAGPSTPLRTGPPTSFRAGARRSSSAAARSSPEKCSSRSASRPTSRASAARLTRRVTRLLVQAASGAPGPAAAACPRSSLVSRPATTSCTSSPTTLFTPRASRTIRDSPGTVGAAEHRRAHQRDARHSGG